MPQRVSVVWVSLGEGVGYVLDLTAEALALFDREGERKNYLILQESSLSLRRYLGLVPETRRVFMFNAVCAATENILVVK
jgi:hypothetical protein